MWVSRSEIERWEATVEAQRKLIGELEHRVKDLDLELEAHGNNLAKIIKSKDDEIVRVRKNQRRDARRDASTHADMNEAIGEYLKKNRPVKVGEHDCFNQSQDIAREGLETPTAPTFRSSP